MTQSHALLAKLCRTAAIAAFAISPALAVDVTYSTTGNFGGANPFTGPQELSITYVGNPGTTVTPPPAVAAQFGVFNAIGPRPGFTEPVNTPFTLVITQSAPSAGSETLTDDIVGNMQVNSSTVTLTFTTGSGGGGTPTLGTDPINGHPALTFSLGGATYWVDQTTLINASVPGGGCTVSTFYPCAPTPIVGAIDSNVVPEPAFYGLIAIGFAGLFGLAIRRRRQQTVA
jgi:hypothetical protein